MDDLLYLAHRIPYPPNKGDKIRSWNILRALAEEYRVHLGCFVDDPADQAHRGTLDEMCVSTCFATLEPRMAKLRSLSGFLSGAPLTLGYYRNRGLARWIADRLRTQDIRRVFVFSSTMAQYVLDGATGDARLIIDFVDVGSDRWSQYARTKRWPESWIYGRESRLLLDFERRVAAAAEVALFVSEAKAALFRRLAPESAGHTRALNNGVDLAYFTPAASYPDPYCSNAEVLVFTGAMDYWANVDAVTWFAREVLPGVRARRPAVEFCIVGSRPASQVRALAQQPGVTVTGRVDDVRPYVAHAALVVAPLRLARGVQNKVLEAMAMGKAVLGTPEAIEGITARSGEEVLCAVANGSFADATISALSRSDRNEIGRKARLRVEAEYGWSVNLAGLKTVFAQSAVCAG